MRYMTQEEIEKSRERRKRIERREEIFSKFLGIVRMIVYTPLSIAFHAVSFVTRGIGFISSFGILAGVYYLYKYFSTPLKDVDSVERAVAFLIFPFIAYTISVATEKIYRYLEDNAF